jgi:hypothetical protein
VQAIASLVSRRHTSPSPSPSPNPPPAHHTRATFDTDNIDIGPERRAYLEVKLQREWEVNSEGSIPYVPYLRAPFYVWVGRPWNDDGSSEWRAEQGPSLSCAPCWQDTGHMCTVASTRSGAQAAQRSGALEHHLPLPAPTHAGLVDTTVACTVPWSARLVPPPPPGCCQSTQLLSPPPAAELHHHEQKVEAPPLFPPTFLYTQSWEDPVPDMEVFKLSSKDTVLTLTSGGCNALNLLIHGAGHVRSSGTACGTCLTTHAW